MTEQLSVSNQKEVPKHKAALQEKYDKEPKKVEKDLTNDFSQRGLETDDEDFRQSDDCATMSTEKVILEIARSTAYASQVKLNKRENNKEMLNDIINDIILDDVTLINQILIYFYKRKKS